MQIKFLKNIKKGKVVTKDHSRGVAFIEFTEHQHALVALRVLNNNPGKVILKSNFVCTFLDVSVCVDDRERERERRLSFVRLL